MSLYDLVKGQLTTCQEYADDALDKAKEYLAALTEKIVEPIPIIDEIKYDWPEPHLDHGTVFRPPRPTDFTMPVRPEPRSAIVEPIIVPPFPDIPGFTGETPHVVWPKAPDTDLPDAPTDPPPMIDIEIPGTPCYTLPPVPSFSEIAIPPDPTISFPTFDGVLPDSDLTPPERAFIYNEALYESELGDALRAKILAGIQYGGTGLGAEVEGAIWNQAKLRTQSENARLYEEALTFWSARGWDLPPGAVSGRLYEVSVEQSRALADINEKIFIEQARLAQEMDKFIMQSGLQMEQQTLTYANEVANRAFQSARATVELGIAVFQAKVVWYTAQLDAYKTQATVYEVRIRAELGKLEVFKAQIEAAKLQVDIQHSEVQLYLAQLQGVTTIIELYKAQIQACALISEINKVRLEIFHLQVTVYQVQVQAKVSEYNLYQAQLGAEETKVKVFSEQVRAYATLIEGLKTQIEAKKTEVDVLISVNKGRIDVMLSEVERYKTLIGGDSERLKALADAYRSDSAVYGEDVKLAVGDLTSQVEIYQGNLSKAKNKTDILLKQAEMNLQSFIHNRTLAIEAAKDGANVCAQLAASSMSAVHAGAQIGYSGSEGTQASTSEQKSESTQTIYQHTYQES
jgi:hypothetical protein